MGEQGFNFGPPNVEGMVVDAGPEPVKEEEPQHDDKPELPRGEDLVLGVLAAHRKSKAKAHKGGLQLQAICSYVRRKYTSILPHSLVERVDEWVPLAVENLLSKGHILNVNAELKNVKPIFILSPEQEAAIDSGRAVGAAAAAAEPIPGKQKNQLKKKQSAAKAGRTPKGKQVAAATASVAKSAARAKEQRKEAVKSMVEKTKKAALSEKRRQK